MIEVHLLIAVVFTTVMTCLLSPIGTESDEPGDSAFEILHI